MGPKQIGGLGATQLKEVQQLIEKRVSSLVSNLENRVRALEAYTNLLHRKIDDQDQYTRRLNLVFRGLAIKRDETPSTIKNHIAAELRRIGLKDAASSIDRAHRYGARKGREQSVIVRFLSWDARNTVFNARIKSNLYVEADLTHRRQDLLYNARELANSSEFSLIKKVIVDRNCVLQAIAVNGKFHSFSSLEEFRLIKNAIEDKCQRIALYYAFLRSPIAPWEQKYNSPCSSCIQHYKEEPANGPDPTRVIGIQWSKSFEHQVVREDYQHHDPKNSRFVYVGRGSKYGNANTGEDAITKFKDDITKSGLIDQVGELKGKILVCHCVPDNECHAQVLADIANA